MTRFLFLEALQGVRTTGVAFRQNPAEHRALADAIGGTPSEWALYRFTVKLREHSEALAACLDRVTASLRAELPSIGEEVAIDASDLPAYANGQRYVSKNPLVPRETKRWRDLYRGPRGRRARVRAAQERVRAGTASRARPRARPAPRRADDARAAGAGARAGASSSARGVAALHSEHDQGNDDPWAQSRQTAYRV